MLSACFSCVNTGNARARTPNPKRAIITRVLIFAFIDSSFPFFLSSPLRFAHLLRWSIVLTWYKLYHTCLLVLLCVSVVTLRNNTTRTQRHEETPRGINALPASSEL